jgi:hypothetical protein
MSTLGTKQNEQPAWEIETTWPNMTQVARLIGVNKSTLSKQADKGRVAFVSCGLGRGERLIPITEAMRLALVYRKVPMEEFVIALARQAAARSGVDENLMLSSFQDLAKKIKSLIQDKSTMPASSTVIDNRQVAVRETVAMKPTAGTSIHRNAGRLRPRVMAESEFPPASLVEAMDSRSPHKHQAQIVQKNAKVVKLGKLRPGNRGL